MRPSTDVSEPLSPVPGTSIRPALPSDAARLREISLAADALFATAGIELPPDDPGETLVTAGRVFVAGRPAAGFAVVTELDGQAHLAQLAVHPDLGRRGTGSALVEAVCADARERGLAAVTLTTFRDVAWNAPWYARRGFEELPESRWGPQLRAQWRVEEAAGIVVAPRIAMRRPLV
ncbi:N-acetylglutamate synthase and related acetyltransferases [Marinactinospora thermotolerans DSM 45154]|uniref:N-acetylglutamate synthase and related acetyltransferases n=1 Tax=Marinactinospora thermotolerans DSM 45154 TaxID=1122192 RepID=A0A1T4LJJ3_9ACTN|nr:N-acetylglutamate synthase and related acetyltransferases [Marinactinospora thermotolerans DSM 45154]